jgi:hypothetical protein
MLPQLAARRRSGVRTTMRTGGILTAIETENAPGYGPPLHRHRETEIFYVLEGHYLFEVDGARFEARTRSSTLASGLHASSSRQCPLSTRRHFFVVSARSCATGSRITTR